MHIIYLPIHYPHIVYGKYICNVDARIAKPHSLTQH